MKKYFLLILCVLSLCSITINSQVIIDCNKSINQINISTWQFIFADLEDCEDVFEEYLNLNIGESENLYAYDQNINQIDNELLTWSSLSPNIVSVDEDGTVKATGFGEAIIKATLENGDFDTVTINVPYVNKIKLSYETEEGNYAFDDFDLKFQNKKELYVLNEDDEIINSDFITWQSSNENIVTVDEDGYIKAVGFGEAIITATLINGKSDTIKVKVQNFKFNISREKWFDYPSADTVDYNDFNLDLGCKEKLCVLNESLEKISDKYVTWESSNNKVVKILDDEYNNIQAVAFGEAIITATLSNGLTDTIKVTVPEINSINIARCIWNSETEQSEYDYNDFELSLGNVECLTTLDNNENYIKEEGVIWKSSNDKIINVSNSGYIKAMGFGTATITATLPSGVFDTIKITVPNISKIAIAKMDMITYERSFEDFELKNTANLFVYDVNNEDSLSIDDDCITWTSSNNKIVSVDEFGCIKAVNFGIATIKATLPNGVYDTINVTVPSLSKIQIISERVSIEEGIIALYDNIYFSINSCDCLRLIDENGDYISTSLAKWKSLNENVAIINDQGCVTAVGYGDAIIVATLSNGVMDIIRIYVEPDTDIINVSGVSLNKTKAEINIGETIQLVEEINPKNATYKSVIWKSSNENIATVSPYGIVKGIKDGTTIITVTTTDGKKTATCKVTVIIPATSVKLSPTTLSLAVGKTSTLKATVSPSNATDKTVSWKSGNTKIATVSSNGVVKGIKAGTATITVTTTDGKKTATCKVTITQSVTSVKVSPTTLTLDVGKTSTLKATISPSTATTKTVSWKSSNTKIATVDSKGVVKGIKAGSATITVTTTDGKKTATCKVTVKNPVVKVKGVKLDKTTLSLSEGNKSTLKATVSPSNATDKTVSWKSSNTSIATVDKNGVVKGIKAGNATITVTTTDGKKTATCKVTITKPTIKVTGVKLDKTSASISKGKTVQLKATVTPSNATDKTVTWTSSNTKIATVSSSGLVKGIAKGTATITVTTKDGSKKATCKITVK